MNSVPITAKNLYADTNKVIASLANYDFHLELLQIPCFMEYLWIEMNCTDFDIKISILNASQAPASLNGLYYQSFGNSTADSNDIYFDNLLKPIMIGIYDVYIVGGVTQFSKVQDIGAPPLDDASLNLADYTTDITTIVVNITNQSAIPVTMAIMNFGYSLPGIGINIPTVNVGNF